MVNMDSQKIQMLEADTLIRLRCGGTWAFSCGDRRRVGVVGTFRRRENAEGERGWSCAMQKQKMNHESIGRVDEIHNLGAVPTLFYTILFN